MNTIAANGGLAGLLRGPGRDVTAPAPQSRADAPGPKQSGRRNFLLRVASAVVLAPLAVAAAWLGGWPFGLFWALAAIAVWWEWTRLIFTTGRLAVLLTGAGILAVAFPLAGVGSFGYAAVVVLLGAAAAMIVAPAREAGWIGAGMAYAASLMIAPLILRQDPEWGFLAILFLFAVIWFTDIVAFLFGRAVGGPKLWPRVSPGKTWSGALAGSAAAVIVALLFAGYIGRDNPLYLGLVGLGISLLAQGGDLVESAVKRRFGAKDTSQMIPGHGGVMDRLDSFVLAAAAAALYGSLRMGPEHSAQGLLLWEP